MNDTEIAEAVESARNGVDKYLEIMTCVGTIDVSSDRCFQKRFNHFYRIRQKSAVWYQTYYDLLEESKVASPSFEQVLLHLHDALGSFEASFSSKLVATIDPDQPIWDSHVLKNIGKSPPRCGTPARARKIVELFRDIQDWYRATLKSTQGDRIVSIFNDRIGENPILTDTKKIDFVLWQHRK